MVEFDTDNLMTSTLMKVDLEMAEREKYKNLQVTKNVLMANSCTNVADSGWKDIVAVEEYY